LGGKGTNTVVCPAFRTDCLTALQIPLANCTTLEGQIVHFSFLTVGYNVTVDLSLSLCWVNFTGSTYRLR
jgi:hypothetical protein